MKNPEDFINNSKEIIEIFNQFVLDNELKDLIIVDHICYKCDSGESFEQWRKFFEWEAKNFYQAVISKRRIATVIFKQSIPTVVGEINYLELSDQKPDKSQTEAFDHIEFIPKNTSLAKLLEIFEEKKLNFIKDEKPHITQYTFEIGKYNFRLAEQRLVDKIKTYEFV